MIRLLEQIRATDRRFGLFNRNDRVLIALSGGPDSVALLQLLSILAAEYDLKLAAAHVNHKLRHEADTDLKFCRMLCQIHGVKFHSVSANIKAKATKQKMGIEQTAREFRYGYFKTLCEKYGYNKIATGHTASDNAETLLFNLARGADIGGLGGIPPRRDNIIRPLIEITKEDLLRFLHEYKISYRIDKTNFTSEYSRNLIRNKIMPLLVELNPKAEKHIARVAVSMRNAFSFIETETEKAYNLCLVNAAKRQIILDLAKLPVYYKSLESWIVIRAYFQLTGQTQRPVSSLIEDVLNLTRRGSAVFLDNGVVVTFHGDKLILSQPIRPLGRIKPLKNGLNKLSGSGLTIRVEETEGFDLKDIRGNRDESTAYLDSRKTGAVSVRSYRDGDRFYPLGLKGTKKLADYLNEKKVSYINKKAVPIVVNNNDVVWVAGYGISDKYKVTDKTEKVLVLKLQSDGD